LLIVGRQQLVRVLRRYVEYNQGRPPRSLGHAVEGRRCKEWAERGPAASPRRPRCLIHEYKYAARHPDFLHPHATAAELAGAAPARSDLLSIARTGGDQDITRSGPGAAEPVGGVTRATVPPG
jgi:hypothetical protein